MLPFGQTIYLWRKAQLLTQADLARATGISRPNLSAIEQGRRDVAVSTVRRLADAFGIKPGVLVDGTPPRSEGNGLTRTETNRIAESVCGKKLNMTEKEQRLAAALRVVLPLAKTDEREAFKHKLGKAVRREQEAIRYLKSALSREELDNLISRVNKKRLGLT